MNKRHYEHTLPNIRGSLSNTYILVYKTKRMLHTHRACNSVLRISLCKWVGNSILLHLRSPHTIFQTERK